MNLTAFLVVGFNCVIQELQKLLDTYGSYWCFPLPFPCEHPGPTLKIWYPTVCIQKKCVSFFRKVLWDEPVRCDPGPGCRFSHLHSISPHSLEFSDTNQWCWAFSLQTPGRCGEASIVTQKKLILEQFEKSCIYGLFYDFTLSLIEEFHNYLTFFLR